MRPDPALDVYIQPPGAYWRRRLLLVVPLLVWVVLAVGSLQAFAPTEDSPTPLALLPVLLGLICVGIGLVLAYIPWLFTATRELGNAFRARRASLAAVGLMQAGDGSGSEALLRGVLGRQPMVMSTLPGLVHNLGVCRLLQGDPAGALALMEHARVSGWLDAFVYRRHRAAYAQGRAVAAVVLGELDLAEAALDELDGQVPRAEARAWVVLARLLLALRRGRSEAAGELIESLEGVSLPPPSARLAGVLVAWTRVLGGEEPALATAGVTPLEPGEPPWGAHWPELMDFAAAHGLLGSALEAEPPARVH